MADCFIPVFVSTDKKVGSRYSVMEFKPRNKSLATGCETLLGFATEFAS